MPLGRLSDLGVTRRHGALGSVDTERHEIFTGGVRIGYDRLIVATGARSVEGVPGATTFRGPLSAGAVEGAPRQRASARDLRGRRPAWMLRSSSCAASRRVPGGRMIVTHERRPLDIFGASPRCAAPRAGRAAFIGSDGGRDADRRGRATSTRDGRAAPRRCHDRSLARIRGPWIEGLPGEWTGSSRSTGTPRRRLRMSSPPATRRTGPIKQGGLAAQQADAAAEAIAAEAGAPVMPRPCRRVLRAGVVLTGERPLYLRRDLDEAQEIIRPLRGDPPGRVPEPALVAARQGRGPLPHRLRRRGRPPRREARRPRRRATDGDRVAAP